MPNKNNLEESLIAEAMKESGGNVSAVARRLGLNYYALRERQMPEYNLTFPRASTPEPEDIRTLGKSGLERYVIAVKPRGTGWPVKYKTTIEDARKKFDAGTHDMYQTNFQGWVVQYLIPLLYPRKACRYFADMVVQ